MITANIATASGHAVSLVQWYQLEKVEIEKSRNYTLYAMILSCHCSTQSLQVAYGYLNWITPSNRSAFWCVKRYTSSIILNLSSLRFLDGIRGISHQASLLGHHCAYERDNDAFTLLITLHCHHDHWGTNTRQLTCLVLLHGMRQFSSFAMHCIWLSKLISLCAQIFWQCPLLQEFESN